MTDDLADFWVHDVVLERFTGAGAYGDTFADPVPATGLVDDTRKIVRGADGEQIVSSATVFLPAITADVPLGSQVTLPAEFGARTSRVVAVSRHDAGPQPTPNHVEVHLL